jgi:hypothetical protein
MTEALAPRLVSRSDDHPRVQRGIGRAPLQRIIDAVAGVFAVDRDTLCSGRGGAPRMITAWLARYEGESRLRSIAATLRLRSSGNPHPGLTAGATDLAPAHAGSGTCEPLPTAKV